MLSQLIYNETVGYGSYRSKYEKNVTQKLVILGVPVAVQQKGTRLGTMRLQVLSLALLSGLRIRRCHELWCSLQMWLGSHIAVALV